MDKATEARVRCDPVYNCSTKVYTAFSFVNMLWFKFVLLGPVQSIFRIVKFWHIFYCTAYDMNTTTRRLTEDGSDLPKMAATI